MGKAGREGRQRDVCRKRFAVVEYCANGRKKTPITKERTRLYDRKIYNIDINKIC